MNNYNKIEKLLHDFVLSKNIINETLYELEKKIFLKKKNLKNKLHVFITGLPRSGTTSILNFLYLSGEYASLTYRNMPFVLSPHFSKLFPKKNISKKLRAHNDGISYNINSPEAFDEIFFNYGEQYIKNELEHYIQLILLSEKKDKYLSKNNLNYKRIDLVGSIFPNSIFLIPIRNPLHHAKSLLNQHLHFSKLQKEDDFIKRYMGYLCHNEFGLNHSHWYNPIQFDDLNNINYWLEQWNLFYDYIYKNFNTYQNCFFIIYEKLDNPEYVQKIIKKTKVNKNNIDFHFFRNSNKTNISIEYDQNIYKKSKLIYEKYVKHDQIS